MTDDVQRTNLYDLHRAYTSAKAICQNRSAGVHCLLPDDWSASRHPSPGEDAGYTYRIFRILHFTPHITLRYWYLIDAKGENVLGWRNYKSRDRFNGTLQAACVGLLRESEVDEC